MIATQSLAQSIQEQRLAHFEPLCRLLDLVPAANFVGDNYGSVSATSGFVRIHFEDDRGLCTFAIGSASDERPLCGIEEMASRFPRIRLLPEGYQRLTLAEQAAFIAGNWAPLQTMFSPEHIAETRRWRQAAVAAYMKTMVRGS